MELPGFWRETLRNWLTRTYLALFTGAALPPSYKRALSHLGFTVQQLERVLPRARSLSDWTALWRSLGDTLMVEATPLLNRKKDNAALPILRQAAYAYFIAQLPLSTGKLERSELLALVRSLYRKYTQLASVALEEVEITQNGCVATGYLQLPRTLVNRRKKQATSPAPALLILSPPGSSKEEMAFLSDPFVEAGFATLRLDLPGIGSSAGALSVDADLLCQEALTYLAARPDIDTNSLLIGGISLATFWAFKTAAVDRRLKGVIAISPAMLLRRQWERLPDHYWQVLQDAFDTPDFAGTWREAAKMTLFQIVPEIRCPILLFHGGLDSVSHPQVLDWFHHHASAPTEARFYRWQGHFLWGVLQSEVLPTAVGWALHQVQRRHASQRINQTQSPLPDSAWPAPQPLPPFSPTSPIAPLPNFEGE